MEDKDIDILENIISYCTQSDEKEVYNGAILFKKLLQAYKQDEKVINEMARYIAYKNNKIGNEKSVEKYFRKKCK